MVSGVRFVWQNARWNTWNTQHKRWRGKIDLSAQTDRQFGFRKSQWVPTCLEMMERRNYPVHGLGNGWERRKDEGKTLSLFYLQPGTRDTLPFSRGPTERSLKDVIDAFETHWNPKKNETVERYRFFTRVQEEGEPLEKFIVDLKILTCNFSTLRESLVRDRIICGIRDSKLREDLLKVADLDLDKCVNACRASNYRKKGTEELRQRQKQSTISLAETKEKRKKTKEIRAAEKRCEPEINPKMQILWTTTSAKKLPSIRCRMSEVPQIKSFRFRLHV